MNFFKLYIGDYQRDTAHLSLAEHGAYLLMLQNYYATERPLPTGSALHRMLRAQDRRERDAIDQIAAQFWRLTDDGLVNDRGSDEIRKADHQRTVNREIGKLGGRPRNTETLTEQETESVLETVCEAEPINNPNQTPDTRKSKSKIKDGDSSNPKVLRAKLALPDWLSPQIWADWSRFRNSRKGWTPRAQELSLATLTRLRAQGNDPMAVIEQSIERGWTGLFELKSEANHANGTSGRKLSAVEQVEQAIADRTRAERAPIIAKVVSLGAG